MLANVITNLGGNVSMHLRAINTFAISFLIAATCDSGWCTEESVAREARGRLQYRTLLDVGGQATLVIKGRCIGGSTLYADDGAKEFLSTVHTIEVDEVVSGTCGTNTIFIIRTPGGGMDDYVTLRDKSYMLFLHELSSEARESYITGSALVKSGGLSFPKERPVYWVLGGSRGCYDLEKEGPSFVEDVRVLMIGLKAHDVTERLQFLDWLEQNSTNTSIVRAASSGAKRLRRGLHDNKNPSAPYERSQRTKDE